MIVERFCTMCGHSLGRFPAHEPRYVPVTCSFCGAYQIVTIDPEQPPTEPEEVYA